MSGRSFAPALPASTYENGTLGTARPVPMPREQVLLTVIWLRLYPMHGVLGFLCGVTHSTVGRVIGRVVPLLDAAGRDTMRLPDPGKHHRCTLDVLLADTPELAVIIDTFEQPVQRPKNRTEADIYAQREKEAAYAQDAGGRGRNHRPHCGCKCHGA